MLTHQIPPEQWIPFFNDFSRQHQGERVTVELLGKDYGAQPEAQEQPLVGIVYDKKESDRYRIEVSTGDSPESLATHEVPAPTQVFLSQTEDGVDTAVEIQSADGLTTLVHFGPIEGPSTFGR